MQLRSFRLKYPLFWLLLGLNILIWLPFAFALFPTIGMGHDSQLFAPSVHASLRSGNMPWDLMTRIAESRLDIFSSPYFSIVYPFYWTLGINGEFAYNQHLMLDASSVIFHMVVASFMFAWFLSRLGCRYPISAFGGISYAYSLHMKLWSSWIWAISTYTWIPLCLLGVWELIIVKRQRRAILYLGISFGMISLAGGLGLAHALVLTGALTLALWLKESRKLRDVLGDIRSIMVGGILGATIGAVHLIPVFYRMEDYIRWHSGTTIIGKFKPPYEGTLLATLNSPDRLLQILFPLQSSHLGNLYVGVGLVILSLMLLVLRSQWQRFAMVLWCISIYFVLDTFGDSTFIHRITYQLPLLGSIRYPIANSAIPVTLLTLMGCLAIEYFTREYEYHYNTKKLWIFIFHSSVFLSIIGLYFIDNDWIQKPYRNEYQYILFLPSIISIFALLLTFILHKKHCLTFTSIAVLFSYLPQYSLLTHPKVPSNRAHLYNQCEDFIDLYNGLREWKKEYPGNTRLIAYLPSKKIDGCLNKKVISAQLLQSLALMANWDVLHPYVTPRPYYEFKQFSSFSSRSALRSYDKVLQAGVSHILTTHPISGLEPLEDFYLEKERVGPFILYEIKDWEMGQDIVGCIRQPAKLSRTKGATSESLIITTHGKRHIELSTDLNLENHPELLCESEEDTINHLQSTLTKDISNGEIRYLLETSRPLLFVSDRVIRDDWVVRINDNNVEPVRVDKYRLALALGTGRQEIIFSHRPPDFQHGLLITILGIIIWSWFAYREWHNRLKKRSQEI